MVGLQSKGRDSGSALERAVGGLMFTGQTRLDIIHKLPARCASTWVWFIKMLLRTKQCLFFQVTVPTFKDGCLNLASKSTQEVRLYVGNFLRCCYLSPGAPRAQYQLQRRGLRTGRKGVRSSSAGLSNLD